MDATRAYWEHMVAAVLGEHDAPLAGLVDHRERVPEQSERAVIEAQVNALVAAEVMGGQVVAVLAARRP